VDLERDFSEPSDKETVLILLGLFGEAAIRVVSF